MLASMAPEPAPALLAQAAAFDANGDGVLDGTEIKAMLASLDSGGGGVLLRVEAVVAVRAEQRITLGRLAAVIVGTHRPPPLSRGHSGPPPIQLGPAPG